MPCRRTVVLALCLLAAPLLARAEAVTVFAPASLKNALDEIEAGWEARSGHTLTVSLAGSSALARQIQRGAPADVFISASPDWMDLLEAQALIDPATRRDLLGNELVLIASGAGHPPVQIDVQLDLRGLLGEARLAMAFVEAVPAGIYGKAALESLEQWQAVADNVVQADNVRAALAFVATGEARYGIVYATDAAASDAVAVIGRFPASTHPAIVYPVAAVAGRSDGTVAAFLSYLQGAEARTAFQRHGFRVLSD